MNLFIEVKPECSLLVYVMIEVFLIVVIHREVLDGEGKLEAQLRALFEIHIF